MHRLARLLLPGLALLAASLPLPAQSAALDFLNRQLDLGDQALAQSGQRLVEGRLRLADNPAQYVIYEKMAAWARGMDAELRNAADLLSYYTVQEAALGQLGAILQDIRLLVLQKGNAFYGEDEIGIIDGQIGQLNEQLLMTLRDSEFNTKKVLSELLKDPVVSQRLLDPASYSLASLDALLAQVLKQRTRIGARMNSLSLAMAGDAVARENSLAAGARGDTDYATETSLFRREQIMLMARLLALPMASPR